MKKKIIFLLITILLSSTLFSGCAEIVATYDAIIYGSGISGMAAALELSKAGKKVLVVEERGISGGNKRFISGGVSFLNLEQGDSAELFTEDIIKTNDDHSNFYVDRLVAESADLPQWLAELGVELNRTIQMPGNSVARTMVAENGAHSGKEVVSKIENALKDNKIPIEYNTKINNIELLSHDRYEVGLEKDTSIVDVRTKSIIFAEDSNNVYDAVVPIQSLQDISTSYAENAVNADATGIRLLELLQADISTSGEVNTIDTYNSDMGMLISPGIRAYGGLLVNSNAKRFVNEMSKNLDVIQAIISQPDKSAYLIYDQKIHEQLQFLDEYYNANAVIKADTITELSEKLDMDEKELYSTIKKYANGARNNTDEDYGRTFNAEFLPFNNADNVERLYAIKVKSFLNLHPAYAVTTDKFETIRGGETIAGIYAIGDTALGVLPETMLHGTEMTYALIMGRDAALSVNEYLDAKN